MDGFYGRMLKIDLNNQTGITKDIGDPQLCISSEQKKIKPDAARDVC